VSFSNPSKKTSNRLDALLSLRGFACLMVVIAHCDPPKASIFYQNYDLSWLLFSAGGVAVRIFFCLSGYLMGKAFYTERYSTDAPGLIKFCRNRALRIFPLYYFTVFILILFVYPELLKHENWGYLVRICTFTYNQALPVTFNGAFWSLSTEVQFYLIVPFIFTYFKHRLITPNKVLGSIFITLVFSFVLRYAIWIIIVAQSPAPEAQSADFVRYIYTPLVTNLDSFLCGFFINALIYSEKTAQNFSKKVAFRSYLKTIKIPSAAILMVLLYLFTAYCKYYNQKLLLFVAPALSASLTSFFIFAFESGANYQEFSINEKLSFKACLRNPLRVFEVFGNLSYGVYLWHLPIIANFNPIFTSEIPLEAYFKRLAATLIASGLLATVTYYFVEIPAVKFKTYKKS
jgi:peptidoglycan/LPS O-acetylase OafA/YrhL